MACDHQVVGGDDVSLFFKNASDIALMTGGVSVEIKHGQAGAEFFDGFEVSFGLGGFHRAIDQFGLWRDGPPPARG